MFLLVVGDSKELIKLVEETAVTNDNSYLWSIVCIRTATAVLSCATITIFLAKATMQCRQ